MDWVRVRMAQVHKHLPCRLFELKLHKVSHANSYETESTVTINISYHIHLAKF